MGGPNPAGSKLLAAPFIIFSFTRRMEENWYVYDCTDEITEAVREKLGVDMSRKYLRLGKIRKILGNTKKD
jgi:hypothetical protein